MAKIVLNEVFTALQGALQGHCLLVQIQARKSARKEGFKI